MRTLWRQAEALAQTELTARSRGEDVAVETAIDPDVRRRIDQHFKTHFNFMFPSNWLINDTGLNKLKRFHEKKSSQVLRVQDVRSIIEKDVQAHQILVRFNDNSAANLSMPSGASDNESLGLWQFQHRHLILMIGHALAAAPDWDSADLTTCLSYHD